MILPGCHFDFLVIVLKATHPGSQFDSDNPWSFMIVASLMSALFVNLLSNTFDCGSPCKFIFDVSPDSIITVELSSNHFDCDPLV